MNFVLNLLFSVLTLFQTVTYDDTATLDDYKWIPDELCESIYHADLSLIKPTKAFHDYKSCISPDGSRIASWSILPRDMLAEIDSITIFESGETQVIVTPCSQNNAAIKKHGAESLLISKQIGAKCFLLFGESSRGYVYRGQNLAQLHTKLLNEGFISAAGKYYDTAIYHLKINGKEAFLAKTPFDYLLASSSKKQLIRMLDTGSGIAGSILDDQEYFESINLAIKGGHEWEHYNSRKSFASLLEEVRNHSETTQEVKDFEEFVSSIETQVIAYHFSDRLKKQTLSIFENEDYASKSFNSIDVSKATANNTKISLDGTVVVYDKEFTKEMVKSMAEILKKRQEKK